MKTTNIAKYLDSGFYYISDKAAKQIASGKLPRSGFKLDNLKIKLEGGKILDEVTLMRTMTSFLGGRGWRWAIHGMPYMGQKFSFQAFTEEEKMQMAEHEKLHAKMLAEFKAKA